MTSLPKVRVGLGLDRQRDALADADAESHQRAPGAAALEFEGGGPGNACARSAKRMAERNGAAIRIEILIIGVDAEFTCHGENL